MGPGEQIFRGVVAVPGRISGYSQDLPVQASRCSNCHLVASSAAASAASTPVGPPLTGSSLMSPARRRGGPPTSYNMAAFCHVLRSGVDPAHILVPRVMPRYRINETQCQELWHYLVNLTP